MAKSGLQETARALVAEGKGLLAADESFGTIEKRLKADGVESNEDTRRAYREMLLGTPGANQFLSGVILFDETLRQNMADGTPFPRYLESQGIIPGIKVDEGAHDMALAPGEKVTDGLDGLRDRLAEYKQLGARFAKWRAVITIGEGIPTARCIEANAHALARYAALCQEAGIVPIVEPETIMDGDHTLEKCAEVTEKVLRATFAALAEQNVALDGLLLKPNMVLAGQDSSESSDVEAVADATFACLLRTVSAAVPGIVFLSGGQTDTLATARLNAVVQRAQAYPAPWQVSFSFARAVQDRAMKAWGGKPENVTAARDAFLGRLRLNGAARRGEYTTALEQG